MLNPEAIGFSEGPLGRLRCISQSMAEVVSAIDRLSKTDASVLIHGETGTGKELVAEALHQGSARKTGPFVVCDLSTIGNALLESELFGHKRGAFTGAERDRAGAFSQAHGGTLFLDEVGELELSVQPRLLRALERKQVKPIGGEAFCDVDVRVVAATNRDLAEEVRAGRFRADLYHRLAVVAVYVPALRERQLDISVLAGAFVRDLCASRSSEPPRIAPEAMQRLREHEWPGNVRELRNVVERALSLAPQAEVLQSEHFMLEATTRARRDSEPPVLDPLQLLDFKAAKSRLLAEFEREYLRAMLQRVSGNVSLAARYAGLARGHLHRLLRKHGLER